MPIKPFSLAAFCIIAVSSTADAADIPTMEDAGYAYEATERCGGIDMVSPTTRRLERAARFRAGRRMFKSAAKQWGKDWVCKTALGNLGNEIDLSDFLSGRFVPQPPPSEIPPLPLLKRDVIAGLTPDSTD